jgi:hypothetical protein
MVLPDPRPGSTVGRPMSGVLFAATGLSVNAQPYGQVIPTPAIWNIVGTALC